MNIKRFNESSNYIPSNEEELISFIDDIISYRVEMQPVKYTDDDWEISSNSVRKSAEEIVKELKRLGVNFDIIFSMKNYNL